MSGWGWAAIGGTWAVLSVVVALGVGRALAAGPPGLGDPHYEREPVRPMGWTCYYCHRPFAHGRTLTDHLLAEHADAVEAGR